MNWKLLKRIYFKDGDGGSGGGDGGGGTKPDNKLLDAPLDTIPPEWQDEARRLRRENASLRERLKSVDDAESQAKIDAAIKKAQEDSKKALDDQLAAERTAANSRLIRAELKAAAIKAGIVDLDGLKLVDTSKLTVNADGDVEGIDALMADVVKTKPYLFKTQGSSSTSTPPSKDAPPPVNAVELRKKDPAAYEAALAAAKKGR